MLAPSRICPSDEEATGAWGWKGEGAGRAVLAGGEGACWPDLLGNEHPFPTPLTPVKAGVGWMFLEHLRDIGDELIAPGLPPHSMAKVALGDANPSVTKVVMCTGHHQRL